MLEQSQVPPVDQVRRSEASLRQIVTIYNGRHLEAVGHHAMLAAKERA